MKRLQTARVLVVDDNPLEAMPILVSLGKAGIGSVYVRGNRKEELPKEPLRGIRVVFLDMDLGVGGTTDKDKVSATIGVLKQLLGGDASPTVLAIWTKHQNLVAEFTTALENELPNLRPGVVLPLEKNFSFEGKESDLDKAMIPALDKEVAKVVDSAPPLDVIWAWEQLEHDAVSRTTSALGQLTSDRAPVVAGKLDQSLQAWLKALAQLLQALVHAAEDEVLNDQAGFNDLLEILGRVQHDKLQREAADQVPPGMAVVLGVPGMNASEAELAAINSMLLLEPVAPADTMVRPGNVYAPSPEAAEKCPFTRIALDVNTLVPNLFNFKAVEVTRKLMAKIAKLEEDAAANAAKLAEKRATLEGEVAKVRGVCKPILVEMTPGCDFAQGKQKVARFVGGLLVPTDRQKTLNQKLESLVVLEPVNLAGLAGTWVIAVDARYLFGVDHPKTKIGSSPLCRLREHVMIHIQSEIAAHAARPGYLSLR